MPSNTLFKPLNINAFTSDVLNYASVGTSANCTANSTTSIDFAITDDMLITGLQLLTNGGTYGDYASLQVIDPNNILGMGANAILLQPVTSWFLPPTASMQFDVVYPAKIYAGLTLRILYTSTAIIGSVFVAVNYKLHKVLK